MTLLSTIVAFLIALGVLIAFHEFGHYLAARLCGVKVLRYCLGFGKPIVSRRWGKDQTEWALAAFPLGGYVKLLGQDPEDPVPPEEAHRAFNNQNVWKRIAIIIAGPVANFILAITVYWGLNLHGIEEPVARMAAPAAMAQLSAGDEITRFDGEPVASWNDLNWRLLQAADERRTVKLETRNALGQAAMPVLDLSRLDKLDIEGDFMGKLGFTLYRPPPKAMNIAAGSPADKGGLKAGDVLVGADGKAIASGQAFIKVMRASPGRAVPIEVLRGGARLSLTVTPEAIEKDGARFGRINAEIDDRPAMANVTYGPVKSLTRGIAQTWEMSIFSLKMLGKMVTGEISWRNLSGPVTIADYAGKTARLGLTYYLHFIALVSVSLGVLNLLPIPMLDGGYLLYYFAEIIRGKPLSERIMEIGTKFGLTLVVVSMVLALYNDLNRLLAG
jgi:regulator of sigma E protease